MSRYGGKIEQQPPQPTTEGDISFIGMNMALSRDQLPPGYFPLNMNGRARSGRAVRRGGTITPLFANIVAFSAILGSGLYNNPNRAEVILVATPEEVLMVKCGGYPTSVAIPAGMTLSGKINFAQDFDKVFLESDDPTQATLQWDGVSPDGFTPIAQSNPADTTRHLTPAVPWSVNMGDRRYFPASRDEMGVSDIADYTSYDFDLGVYRVNAGTSDPIVGAVPFTQGFMLVGKERSWDVLSGVDPLSITSGRMDVISPTIGLSGRRTPAVVGAEVIFLYRTGVYKIGQIIQNRIQASPRPVATKSGTIDPIAPLLARINWSVESGFVSAIIGPYYVVAVALDGATGNNALLVYNTVSDEWEGFDTWDPGFGMQIDNLLVTSYQGTPQLYAVNHALKKIHVLGIGQFDHNGAAEFEIRHLFQSRGYATLGWNAATRRDNERLEVALRTWRPSVRITLLTEGAADARELTPTPIAYDRRKYFRWGMADYDPSNVNDDFQTPGREDYSISLADGPLHLGSGVSLEQMQERTVRFALKARSRWTSVQIENTQGNCEIAGILFESTGITNERRRAG